MKLMRQGNPGRERPAVRLDEHTFIDVSDVVGYYDEEAVGHDGLARLANNIEERVSSEQASKVVDELIPRPHQIRCIGLNYADHAAETWQPLPTEPILFTNTPKTLGGTNDYVRIPRGAIGVDWEVETTSMWRINEAFDPHGTLNPGRAF